MDKMEAHAERARLQELLDAYQASRLTHQDEDERRIEAGRNAGSS
jgi:hypothetical protein